jgi:protein gp37
VPAAVRFISYEPAIGRADFCEAVGIWWNQTLGAWERTEDSMRTARRWCDWVIVGGESGPGARPFDVQWARQTIAQCRAAGVPVFVKQLSRHPFDSEAHWISRGGPVVIPVLSGWTIREALRDHKGGDIEEFPADLRVRDFPAVVGAADRTEA